MKKRVNLDKANVRVLPPKVIKLLAQFAYYLKKHNGTIIKLSSNEVLQDVHQACLEANFEVLDNLYEQIVDEVSSYTPSKAAKQSNQIKARRLIRTS